MIKPFIIRFCLVLSVCFAFYVVTTESIIRIFPKTASIIFPAQEWLKTNLLVLQSQSTALEGTVYIGDSVGKQVIGESSVEKENQLLFNAATLPVGSYFLVKEAITHNKDVDTVVYYITPKSLALDFAWAKTNTYFVKAFFNKKNKEEIFKHNRLKSLLSQNKLLVLNQFPSYKCISFFDYNYSDGREPNDIISSESLYWLGQIDSLCAAHKVDFFVRSPPLPRGLKRDTNNWANFKRTMQHSVLSKLFNPYFQTLTYYPDEHSHDGLHMSKRFLTENGESYFETMLGSLSAENP